MRVHVDCAVAKVVESTPEERIWLRSYLTFQDPQARFSNGNPVVELFNDFDNTFPAGFAGKVRKAAAARTHPSGRLDPIEVEMVDVRKPPAPRADVDLSFLRDYQRQAVESALSKTRGIIQISTGGGKCLGRGTGVLKFDGTIIPVEQVQVGDLLMGPDSKPRRVLSTTQGTGPLFKIVPLRGQAWVCNDVHVLTLAHTRTGELVDIPLNEYLQQSPTFKHLHKQTGTGVEFAPCGQLPIDPYFLGVWYGDGSKNLQSVSVSKPDVEIRELMQEMAEDWGLELRVDQYREGDCPTYRLVKTEGKRNPLITALRSVVGDATTLPHEYLTASRWDRECFLAGLLDTDGHLHRTGYEITQKQKGIADGIMFLARSLGMRAICKEKVVNGTVYYRVHISGDCSSLPLRIERKKAGPRRINKNPTRTGFSVEALGVGEYFGFTLDDDGRFLLGDFTITHNTECMAGIVACVPERWLIIVPQADLLMQTADRIEKRTGERPGIIGDGQWAPSRITVATFQTLSRRMSRAKDKRAYEFMASMRGVIVDECHSAASGTLLFVLSKATNAYYRIGFSATPLDRSDKKSLFVISQLGGIIHRTTSAELRAMGMLADAHITMVRVEQGSTAPTWQGVYGECIVRSKVRNAVVVEMTKRAKPPALVFVSQVRQGQMLLPMIKAAGLRAELVWGEDDTEARKRALDALVAGRLDVIICSSVFQQAIDIPTLEAVINAAGGASVIQALQRIGRGTRVTADKKAFQVFDVFDDGNRWLNKHSRTRQDTYEKEGYQVRVIEASDLGVTVADPRRDEHGFVKGSAAQAAHRAAIRRDALRSLAGVDNLRMPSRGRILRPHQPVGGECSVCGAGFGNWAEECPGYRPEEA